MSGPHDHDSKCIEIAERLSEYLDGELPDELRALVEMHNLQCSDCDSFMQSLRRTKDLAHLLPRLELSDEDLARLAAEARKRLE